jgi:hypothetical protein
MKKTTRRLTLSRETILRLDEPKLRTVVRGGNTLLAEDTQDVGCESPLCGPTYWETCDCTG